MKKFLLPILLFLMFIPFVANAETCNTDKITISSITVENKSDNVEELEAATASGKNINLNLSMLDVGDNIEYKFVVKNDSNEDYELDKTSLNLNSDYISYSFETEDDTNIVKANSSKNITLRIEYKNEVPEDKFKSGSYNDSKTMMVQLSNGNTINMPDTFKNPNTGVQSFILVILILLLISGSLYVLLKKKKYTKFMALVIGTAIIIPISVYALCNYNIKINTSIKIDYLNSYYYNPDNGHYLKYRKGMTWKEYIDYIYEHNNMITYSKNDKGEYVKNGILKLYEFDSNNNGIEDKYLIAVDELNIPNVNNLNWMHTFFGYGIIDYKSEQEAYYYPSEFLLAEDYKKYDECKDIEAGYILSENTLIINEKCGQYYSNPN